MAQTLTHPQNGEGMRLEDDDNDDGGDDYDDDHDDDDGDGEDDDDHGCPLQVQQRRAGNARPGCANFCSSRTDALPWFVLCLPLSLFSITSIKMINEK